MKSCLFFFFFLQLGVDEADSAQRFQEWVSLVVHTESSSKAFTYDNTGGRVQGLYHNLKFHEHSAIEAALCKCLAWNQEITQNNLSAGLFMCICGGGKGTCTCIAKRVGPFQD